MTNQILHGDCLEELKKLPENSVDAIVTDPPYGLSFMGKKWDYDVPSTEIWQECLRVLKPGGYLLAFAGTRTQHRMAVRIEDAGFEIRDMIAWVYGSGFPKSLNIGKAIDKINGESGRLLKFTTWMRTAGLKSSEIDKITGTNMGGHYLTTASQPAIPTRQLWAKLKPHIKIEIPIWVDELVERIEREREVIGKSSAGFLEKNNVFELDNKGYGEFNLTKGTSEWEGWGTALKPALEPITVARKPLSEKTVAENCLRWGVGGINIEATRVPLNGDKPRMGNTDKSESVGYGVDSWQKSGTMPETGRFPSNLIHDGSDEVVSLFPSTKGGTAIRHNSGGKTFGGDNEKPPMEDLGYGDSGSAARFFYCAKSSRSDRNSNGSVKNTHATVKPTKLMKYLVKLVSREGALILDPFLGSGTTALAAKELGRNYIGIEREKEYVDIAAARLAALTPTAPNY